MNGLSFLSSAIQDKEENKWEADGKKEMRAVHDTRSRLTHNRWPTENNSQLGQLCVRDGLTDSEKSAARLQRWIRTEFAAKISHHLSGRLLIHARKHSLTTLPRFVPRSDGIVCGKERGKELSVVVVKAWSKSVESRERGANERV